MNCDALILFAGNPYAFPNAGLFLLATLAGAAAELSERRCQKNSRFLIPTFLGAAIGLAAGILLMLSGDRRADEIFPIWCAAGTIGGFLGAAVVKTRKKRKNGDPSDEETAEKSIAPLEKKNRKALKIAAYVFGLFCAFGLGAFSVFATQVAGRFAQSNKFYKNSEAFRNAFERGAYAEAFLRACACEAAGRDFPNNEMFLSYGLYIKAKAAEMTGDYDVASESYAAYKVVGGYSDEGCVVTYEPRLAYKQGKKNEAFRGYCDLFALEEEGLPSGEAASEPARLNRRRSPKTATSIILLLDYAEKDRVLSPFAEYADFLTFMEAEFKAQGEPTGRVETMEFFRSLAKDADGDNGENGGGERSVSPNLELDDCENNGESEPTAAGETNDEASR